MRTFAILPLAALLAVTAWSAAADDTEPKTKLNEPPKGFTALFNGKNLDGWQIAVDMNERKKFDKEKLAQLVKERNEKHLKHWKVEKGVIAYDGKGMSLQTAKDYGDIELYVDWKIEEKGDSGLYLRGNPQVQIWDSERTPGARGIDKHSGSGGLWNNPMPKLDDKAPLEKVLEVARKIGKVPLKKADKPVGEWNTFHIIMKGDKVTVNLNGVKVVDNAPLANYWEKGKPLPATGPIELQHHGDKLWFRNIYVKELKD
jgi:hypothetical protein